MIDDDDPVCQAVLNTTVRSHGFFPRVFSSGSDAWRALQSDRHISLVVANWLLPGLDGYWICRWLSEWRPSVCTVLMVGRSCPLESFARFAPRAKHILAKPLRLAEIDGNVRAILAAAMSGGVSDGVGQGQPDATARK